MNDSTENNATSLDEQSDENKFIVFSLGSEFYGTRLLDVREVVESLPVKPVPNTIDAFRGVCNLRGQITGIIDLKTRFKMKEPTSSRPVFILFDTDSGAIGAVVDKIDSVSEILSADIETKPNIVSAVPTKYILGVGKIKERMVILIDLRTILSTQELTDMGGFVSKSSEQSSHVSKAS